MLPMRSCRSSISRLMNSIFFRFCSISSFTSSSFGSFLPLFFSSAPVLLESSRISSLNVPISLMRSTFSFMMRMFSCLWMSASFCKFFLSMAMDFSRYFFWFLYSCSISESILACAMLWDTNFLCRSAIAFLSCSSSWISWAALCTASLKLLILLVWQEMRARCPAIFAFRASSFLKKPATFSASPVLSAFSFFSLLSIWLVLAFMVAISFSLGAMSFLSSLILWSSTYLNFSSSCDFFLSSQIFFSLLSMVLSRSWMIRDWLSIYFCRIWLASSRDPISRLFSVCSSTLLSRCCSFSWIFLLVIDTSLLALRVCSVMFWCCFAWSLAIFFSSSSFSSWICLIVSRCSFFSRSIFLSILIFWSRSAFICSLKSSSNFFRSFSFSIVNLLISMLKFLDSCSCALFSSSYLALSCITFLA